MNEDDPWCGPPLIPGNWRDLNLSQSLEAVRLIAGCGIDMLCESDYEIRRLRALPLTCFQDSLLYEVQAWLPSLSRKGLMNFVHTPIGVVLLDGASAPFHVLDDLRDTGSQDKALQFCDLFCSGIFQAQGRFNILRSPDSLGEFGRNLPEKLLKQIKPPVIVRNLANDGWELTAIVHYVGFLFRTRFAMKDGMGLVMEEDLQLDEEAQALTETWHQQFRLPETLEGAGKS